MGPHANSRTWKSCGAAPTTGRPLSPGREELRADCAPAPGAFPPPGVSRRVKTRATSACQDPVRIRRLTPGGSPTSTAPMLPSFRPRRGCNRPRRVAAPPQLAARRSDPQVDWWCPRSSRRRLRRRRGDVVCGILEGVPADRRKEPRSSLRGAWKGQALSWMNSLWEARLDFLPQQPADEPVVPAVVGVGDAGHPQLHELHRAG